MKKIKFIKNLFIKYNEYFEHQIKGSKNIFRKSIYLADVIIAYIIYGSKLSDYFEYEFYKKRHYERKAFVTYRRANEYWRILNKKQYHEQLNDKLKIYKNFSKYLGREYIYMPKTSFEEFYRFTKRFNILIAKPRRGYCGVGLRKMEISENTDLKKLYEELKSKDLILEEHINQITEIADFHPYSVNTIRVATVLKDSQVNIMDTVFRIGNNRTNMDNHAAGGIITAIDKETGITVSLGIDKYSNKYLFHPITKKQIVGYKIPFWDEIINLTKELAIIVPEIGYVGWDIALTEQGPVVIEGNYRGMFDVQQQALQIGLRNDYDKVLFEKN